MTKSKEIRINDQTKGIICIILAAVGFSLMTFFVRLSGDLPTMQKAFFRNAFAAVVALSLLVKEGKGIHIVKENRMDIFMRCIIMIIIF